MRDDGRTLVLVAIDAFMVWAILAGFWWEAAVVVLLGVAATAAWRRGLFRRRRWRRTSDRDRRRTDLLR